MWIYRRAATRGPGRRTQLGLFPLGTVLVFLVVLAAALSGTAHFAGPRWLPHFNAGSAHSALRSLATLPPVRQSPPSTSTGKSTFPLAAVLFWVLIAAAVLAAAFLLWRLWLRRPARRGAGLGPAGPLEAIPPAAPAEPEPEPDVPVLRSGVEQALRLLDSEREPADAVLRAWLGLQETAEQSGIVRRASETPTEFTTRIMARVFADDHAVRTLLCLYLRVRFGEHEVSVHDVATARSALRDLARTWDAGRPAGRR